MAELTILPTWALNHLNENLADHTHIINALPVKEGRNKGTYLVNTSQGAVMLTKTFAGEPKHWFLPLPARHFSFICQQCLERIEFVDPSVPRTIYCTHCGARYLLGMEDGKMSLRPEQTTGHYQPETASKAKAEPIKAPPRPAKGASVYVHDGYTLYRRETEKKGGGTTTFYFFAKNTPKSGQKCGLPDGYVVEVNERTKLPYLRRTESEAPAKPAKVAKAAPKKVAKAAKPAKPAKARARLPYDYKGQVHEVVDLEGIGPTYAKKLGDAGIKNTQELLFTDDAKLEKLTGAPAKTIQNWKDMSQLIKISGIGPQFAELMVRAGIAGIDGLKKGEPKAMVKQIKDYEATLSTNVTGSGIGLKRMTGWHEAAKNMRRVPIDVSKIEVVGLGSRAAIAAN